MSGTAGEVTRAIFRTEAMVVSAPFVDGAPVESRELGCHGSLEAALAWINCEAFREELELQALTEKLLFIRVTERALDVGPSDYRGHLTLSAAESARRCRGSIRCEYGRRRACREGSCSQAWTVRSPMAPSAASARLWTPASGCPWHVSGYAFRMKFPGRSVVSSAKKARDWLWGKPLIRDSAGSTVGRAQVMGCERPQRPA